MNQVILDMTTSTAQTDANGIILPIVIGIAIGFVVARWLYITHTEYECPTCETTATIIGDNYDYCPDCSAEIDKETETGWEKVAALFDRLADQESEKSGVRKLD